LGQKLQAVPVVPPTPTCESPSIRSGSSSPTLPDMLFLRPIDYFLCLRHQDGCSEKLLKGGPWMQVSPDGNQLAYWLPEKHELHLFSLSDRKDLTVDSVPNAIMRQIVWSSNSQTLAYLLSGKDVRGLHVIDITSGTRQLINGIFGTLAPALNPKYFLAVSAEGVYRINIADGQRNLVSGLHDAADGAYSPRGTWLGVLVSQPSNSTATDDEPDLHGWHFCFSPAKSRDKTGD
jgi:hypothetical protein